MKKTLTAILVMAVATLGCGSAPKQATNDGKTSLMIAAANTPWSNDEIDAILDAGLTNIDAQDKNGNTALMLAIDPAVHDGKRLIKAGADPRIKNKKGESAISIACEDGFTDKYEFEDTFGLNWEKECKKPNNM